MYYLLSFCLIFKISVFFLEPQLTDRLDSIRAFSQRKETAFASGFACRFYSNGVETIYHKYPGEDEFYLGTRSPGRETVSVFREGKSFMLLRTGDVDSDFGAWQLTHIGDKHRTTDGSLFQVERVVKSPWTILGTPLHVILADPNVKRLDTGTVNNTIELEFKREPNPNLNMIDKRPFFTDHERVSIIFESGEECRIISLAKTAIGPNRGIQESIRYGGDDHYTVTGSDGVAYDVTIYSRDWTDRRELYLSHYGLSAIEEVIEQKPKSSFYFVLLLTLVGGGLFVLAYFAKKRSSR